MAPRPYWKGYLKLSLVSCPIALYPATSASERVSFRQINKQTGNRLRQQLVDDVTREPVEADDKGRGYEVGKNDFIPIEDEEIEALAIESTHTIDIDSFVPRAQIDERYFETPYYIAPNDEVGQEAFAVIREAMRGKDMVALGRVVLSKRERVMTLRAVRQGPARHDAALPLRGAQAEDYFDEIPDAEGRRARCCKLAEHILESKQATSTRAVRRPLRERRGRHAARRSRPAAGAEEKAPKRRANVVNLMDALRRSVQGAKSSAPPAKADEGQEARRGPARNASADFRQGQRQGGPRRPRARARSPRRGARPG